MYSYYSPYAFLSFLLIIIINLFVDLPKSFCADDPNYRACNQPFKCGDIENITYPFWKSGRAEFCGHQDFELECKDDSAEIEFQSQTYRVVSIDHDDKKLRLATTISGNNNCPTDNISFPSNSLRYLDPLNQNITLFYQCPFIPELAATNKFVCSVNNPNENYFWRDSVGEFHPELSRCNLNVTVTFHQTLFGVGSQLNLGNILNEGFDVLYAVGASLCKECEDSGGACGYDRDTAQPKCFCFDGPSDGRCLTNRTASQPTVQPVNRLFFGIGGVLASILVFCCQRFLKAIKANSILFWKRKKKAHGMVEDFLKNYGSLAPKRYSYSDIKNITCSFKDKIGQGGYGGVYKGKLLDGRLVAVKLLDKAKDDGEEFINEVASISRTSHVNVVSLLGFCFDGSKRALVYEFMVNGSLEKFIYGHNTLEAPSQLGYEKLYEIAIGVARGLEYLHRGCNTRILHFDIKPHNILLDKDFTPKISDFGLAKLCSREESIISILGARGTVGYIAPEVFSRNFGAVSHKSDVYSYGMMVLEIVGKRKNVDVTVDHTSRIYFPQWIYKRLELNQDLGLPGIISNVEEDITRKLILVALWCIQTNPVDRPGMSRVVEMLEARQEILPIPPKPYLCSPPRSAVHSSNT
ncbi:hypothetical protein AQUCO_04100058v1 [Aquilegia coerulea]|uniref:Protein kinase domain-containing protein n=1 Tax=Aquilegia coerulea TaxID=218851 RepID=A0A2G5CPX9_AQUCA|nr:hypothetical protein AQUCO_04100058v1 [Aquilegia coerulea]